MTMTFQGKIELAKAKFGLLDLNRIRRFLHRLSQGEATLVDKGDEIYIRTGDQWLRLNETGNVEMGIPE